MQEPGFWEDDGRHAVLREAEYLDRLEAAFETSARLGERLSRQADKANGAGELAGLLSLRLYVLQSAITGLDEGRTADLFLRLRLAKGDDGEAAAEWLQDLAAMYVAWAERRGMRLRRISDDEHLYAISGLGADQILGPEAGLHLLEISEQSGNGAHVDRVHVHVELARSGLGPSDQGRSPVAEARAALEQIPASTSVVRRYRFKPAPLVRDAARGYRTGRIDRVLAGDFDLY